jgi:hypothetical protein
MLDDKKPNTSSTQRPAPPPPPPLRVIKEGVEIVVPPKPKE